MRILIAVPTFESIYPDTFKSIYGLDSCGNELMFDFVRGYDVATARNRIAQRALDEEADYVLMVDNDVVLQEETLQIMLEDPKDVILGYYAHRDEDNIYRGNTSVCKLYKDDGTKYKNYPLESEYTAQELRDLWEAGKFQLEIHGGGMGCALIRTEVFRKIRYPYYQWVIYADDQRGMLSEDLYFCEQLRHHRIPVYTDTRLRCGHMLRHVQWPE